MERPQSVNILVEENDKIINLMSSSTLVYFESKTEKSIMLAVFLHPARYKLLLRHRHGL